MADTTIQVQKAIFDILKADVTIAGLVGTRIFDTVPDKTDFPYINFEPFDSATEETKDQDGQMHSFQIDVWSRYRGTIKAREIIAAIRDAVHRVPLSISNGDVVFNYVNNTRVLMDSDKRTIHGIVEMQIKVFSN